MQKFITIIIAWGILFGCSYSFAQSDSTGYHKMEAVVVTGQYQPQSLKRSVYQVRVISSETIKASGATNIQQVLNHQLGFRLSNDNTLGIADVKLNGMGGTNVKILLDGVPMVDRYDQRVSLSQIDMNTIERIEIVEGPMSVAYGSDAMAGVINIITKKVEKNNFSMSAHAQEETAGNEYYPFSYKGVHTQNVNLNYAKRRIFASIGGAHNDFDGFGGDGYGRGKIWKPKEQWMGHAKLGYVKNHLNIYYRIDAVKENIVVRNPMNMSNYKAIDQEYITHRNMHQLRGRYRLSDKIQWSGFVAYTDYRRQTNTTRHDFLNHETEPNRTGEDDVSILNSLALKATMEYKLSSTLTLQPGIDINHEKASGARISGSPVINDYAFFVSAEIKPTTTINIRPGLRVSSNSQYSAPPVIPSLNTKFILSEDFDLRLAYGFGFRAPTLRELYLTFFDANHSLIGNTDLKAEYSYSVNGSLTFTPKDIKNVGLRSTLSGFYSAFRNQIQLMQSITDNTEYTYYNTEKSKIVGGSLDNHLTWKKLELSLGFSYTGYSSRRFDDENYIKEDDRKVLWTPEINSNVSYRIEPLHTSVGLFYKFIGKKPAFSFGAMDSQEAIVLTQTASYQLADFTITSDINEYLTTQAGVKNIFDVTTVNNSTVSSSTTSHSGSGPVSIGYGRSFFIGLTFHWAKK